MSTTTYRDPERLDKASASAFEIDAACPGRQNMLRALPPEAFRETSDEDAAMGTRIHKARETGNTLELDSDELDIYRRGMDSETEIVSQWAEAFSVDQYKEGPREVRLWLNDPQTLRPVLSAKLDVHYVALPHVLVIDWKSLWCKHLTPAVRNYQARVQAVCAANEYGAMHVRVAFNKAMFGKSDPVDYTLSDLPYAEHSLFYHLWESRQPDAQRKAGQHCNYCVAKAWCPEAGAYSMLPSVVAANAVNGGLSDSGLDPKAMVERLVPADLVMLFRRSGVITKILEEAKSRLKGFSDGELEALGLRRKEGRKLDPIVDAKGAFECLRDEHGISESELWSAMKISKAELVDAIRRDQGWGKEQTQGFIDGQLSKVIDRKRAESSLEAL